MTEHAKQTPRGAWQAKLTWRTAALRAVVRDYAWIHIGIGLFGNLLFFVGSVFFLWASWQTAGVWLFILGSFAMLLGSLGEALARWERRIGRREDA
ncbi:MAG: YrhK family protein [Rhodovibrionaceae bacterium]